MKSLQQDFTVRFTYRVHFTRQVFHQDNPLFSDTIRGLSDHLPADILFIIDSGLAAAHPGLAEQIQSFQQHHSDAFQVADILLIPGGEAGKNDPVHLETILKHIHDHHICKHSFVVGIGGGALLDLTGYAASISHRGVKHIRIPTTVLSQNDSGVGVKNGINYFGKKNFIGNFAPPEAVINDFSFLSTLDDRDWKAGIPEAIKVALIKDAAFWADIRQSSIALSRRNQPEMEALIYRCAFIHLDHIGSSGDPFEKGTSRPLDFGHWAAHKLEQMSAYQLRHGEAVAIGIALDVTYAHLIGYIDETDLMSVLNTIHQCGLSFFSPLITDKTEELLNGLEEFREHLGGQLSITLPNPVGTGTEVHEVDHHKMKEACHKLAAFFNHNKFRQH